MYRSGIGKKVNSCIRNIICLSLNLFQWQPWLDAVDKWQIINLRTFDFTFQSRCRQVCAQEKSRVVISHVPSQDKRSWLLWNATTDVTYRPIVFPVANVRAADLISDLHFSSRQWLARKKVLPFVARKWAARRRLVGGRMGTARCTRREIMAKGTWRGVGISSRRHYRPRALTVRAIESLFSSWVPLARRRWARPQSGLSLSAERYIRLVRIWQKNCRSWVIDDVPAETCNPLKT